MLRFHKGWTKKTLIDMQNTSDLFTIGITRRGAPPLDDCSEGYRQPWRSARRWDSHVSCRARVLDGWGRWSPRSSRGQGRCLQGHCSRRSPPLENGVRKEGPTIFLGVGCSDEFEEDKKGKDENAKRSEWSEQDVHSGSKENVFLGDGGGLEDEEKGMRDTR